MTGLTRLAGMLARTPLFQRWVAEQLKVEECDADEAAEYIRIMCGVASRKDIETDLAAAHCFEEDIRKPYMRWKEQQKQAA